MCVQLNTCVALGCYIRITEKVNKKGQNSGKRDLDLNNLASLCSCLSSIPWGDSADVASGITPGYPRMVHVVGINNIIWLF